MKEININDICKYYDPLAIRPHPAITLASDGKRTNGLTIGWGSIGILWSKPMFTVYIHKQRYSKEIFDKAEYFAVCFFDDNYKNELKYFGSVSGRDEDKMKNSGLTVNTSDLAPYFEESKMVILCKMSGISDFDIHHVDPGVQDWYDKDGVHTQYNGVIQKVFVKE